MLMVEFIFVVGEENSFDRRFKPFAGGSGCPFPTPEPETDSAGWGCNEPVYEVEERGFSLP